MPSFDIVSKVDSHEISNAVDQTNREIGTRFDFKGTDAKIELTDNQLTLIASSDFQLEQVKDILLNKLAKRNVDARSLDYKKIEVNNKEARQVVDVKQGISSETAKSITKLIKDKKFKVQASIQGEQVRVTGKKRDDLQEVIAAMREAQKDPTINLPLQFENFRD